MKGFVKITVAALLAVCMLLSVCSCGITDPVGGDDTEEATESDSVSTDASTEEGNGDSSGNGDSNDKENGDKEEDEPKVIEDIFCNVAEKLSSIKTHGRTTVSADGLVCDFSSSGIEFNAYIEGALKIDIKVEQGIKVADYDARNDDCYFTLYIDGVRSDVRFKANKSSETTLTLAEFAEGGVHNI